MPNLDPAGGTYAAGDFPLDVTITVQSPANRFRYTINDTTIGLNNGIRVNATSGVVSVDNRDVLRVIAIDPQNRVSRITVAEYDHDHEVSGGGGPPHTP